MAVTTVLRSIAILLLGSGICLVLIQTYTIATVVLLLAAFLVFLVRLEKRQLTARELILIATLSATAAIARLPFAAIPSVQATSFVVIVTGVVFGSGAGFLVGAVAACASNLFLGQGLWTPFQMLAWGLMGAGAGWLRRMPTWILCFYGAVTGLLFGWFMNVVTLLPFLETISWEMVILTYVQSIWFDVAHACANVIFLALFSRSWIRLLTRYRDVHGVLH
ncbi:ECF transporter S component [Aureibacillus halotolerans]|uniref:Energy-coupling factor transport system substrate-specific component n=1 Tax=Aureibacillus halotolerans TaxID=1508390 RepID=A0A4R6UAT2_9BACI|nr:ECF transporter S component [Aureibacillus halotolerans]TDQ42019.1 energy-coupling factor transport system substrate-specific component [Aureibacillus halotolerans]